MLGRIPDRLERVAVAVRRPAGDERSAWFTFRPDPEDRRPVEDRTLRGLHPMVAERLGLWRLRDFELTRLPAPVDVHLFRAVGKNVPDDKRLVDPHRRPRPHGAARRVGPHPRAAPAGARARRLHGRAAHRPRGRPGRRAHRLEPRAALPVAGGARRPRRAGRGRPHPGAPLGGAGAGAGARPVPARGVAGGGAAGVRAADVAAAGRGPHGARHAAADVADARARRLHAEGDPGAAPGRGVPVRAGADAVAQPRPGRRRGHVHRVRPRRSTATRCRSTARRGRTRRASCWARSPRPPSATRRA